MKKPNSGEAHSRDSSASSRATSGFRAHLQGVGLHDLVVLQNVVRASGVFVVISGERSGSLHFSGGHLFHAEAMGLKGDAAALAILSWRDGEFINAERTSTEAPTITSSIEALLVRLARDSDESRHSEPPTTATGIRRRMQKEVGARGPGESATPNVLAPSTTRGLAAAATPGIAALAPRFATRAGEGATSVLVSPRGSLIDGNGVEVEVFASRVAYVTRLAELIGQAMGAGDPRSVKVRSATTELFVRRHADGHISGSLGPPDAGADAAPPSGAQPSGPGPQPSGPGPQPSGPGPQPSGPPFPPPLPQSHFPRNS